MFGCAWNDAEAQVPIIIVSVVLAVVVLTLLHFSYRLAFQACMNVHA